MIQIQSNTSNNTYSVRQNESGIWCCSCKWSQNHPDGLCSCKKTCGGTMKIHYCKHIWEAQSLTQCLYETFVAWVAN